MAGRLGRVLNHQFSVGGLIELALWLAVPYLFIGFLWATGHPEQVDRIEARLQPVLPTWADVGAFGLAAASWPVALQIADACPAP